MNTNDLTVHFKTYDGRTIKLFKARVVAQVPYEQGDTVSDSISGRFPIEIRFFEGTDEVTAKRSYVIQVGVADRMSIAARKERGWKSSDAKEALAALDKFNPLALLPDALPRDDKEAIRPQFVEYFVRRRERLKDDAIESLR